MSRWEDVANKAEDIYNRIPESYRPAFYQLFYYPARSGYAFYDVYLSLGRNNLHAIERRNSANTLATHVLDRFDDEFDLVKGYDELLDGKWKNIMQQPKHGYADVRMPPIRDMISGLSYVQLRQNIIPALGRRGCRC